MTQRAPVYLDHNATTPVRPAAAAAVLAALEATGNPSSVHAWGRRARRTVEDARERVARLAGAPADGVVFTSGGTEANLLALRGCGRSRVLVSAVEHPSAREAVGGVEAIPVDAEGVVDLAALEALLAGDSRPAVVSVMLANNETGVLQPVGRVAAIARRHGALTHCDAVQAAGKVSLDMATLGVDMLSLSAHKLGGPQGVGALLLAPGARLERVPRSGGGQEGGRRGGTENVPGIAGFGAAAEEAEARLPEMFGLAGWRDAMETALRNAFPGVRIFGSGAARLPNTSCIGLAGATAAVQVAALDLEGVMVGAGSACSSGRVAVSRVLAAMGVETEIAAGAVRVSLGWTTTRADVARFVAAWTAFHGRRADRAA